MHKKLFIIRKIKMTMMNFVDYQRRKAPVNNGGDFSENLEEFSAATFTTKEVNKMLIS